MCEYLLHLPFLHPVIPKMKMSVASQFERIILIRKKTEVSLWEHVGDGKLALTFSAVPPSSPSVSGEMTDSSFCALPFNCVTSRLWDNY